MFTMLKIRVAKQCFQRFLCTGTAQQEKLLKAVVLGAPNAGKSTLINTLIGRKIFPVSHKVHTTQRAGVGVVTENEKQVVLIDTPGLIPYQYGRRLKMPKTFLTGAQRSLEEAHAILVVVDSANKRTRSELEKSVLDVLKNCPTLPTALILNKVDLVKPKRVLLEIVSLIMEKLKTDLNESYQFNEVFMVSGLTGCGVDAIKNYLLSLCVSSPWEFKEDITDQSPETMVEEVIREKLLEYFDKEIPYIIKQSTVVWEKVNDKLTILKNLDCKKSSQASIVIGPQGKTIQAITSEAQTALESMLNCQIDLSLNVRSIAK